MYTLLQAMNLIPALAVVVSCLIGAVVLQQGMAYLCLRSSASNHRHNIAVLVQGRGGVVGRQIDNSVAPLTPYWILSPTSNHRHNYYKKLSCRRETARRFVPLNISSSHSSSFEMTLLSRACVSPY